MRVNRQFKLKSLVWLSWTIDEIQNVCDVSCLLVDWLCLAVGLVVFDQAGDELFLPCLFLRLLEGVTSDTLQV